MATAMEGAAGIATVNEQKLQSHTGTIRLFPQVPVGEPASFVNLGARGGFLVSAALAWAARTQPLDDHDAQRSERGQEAAALVAVVTEVLITSAAGEPVTFWSPWPTAGSITVTQVPSGTVVDVVRQRCDAIKRSCSYSWPTRPALQYAVAAKP
jgi:hypothetical protein